MLEHGGHHHCRVHGIHVALYSPSGPTEAVASPLDFGPSSVLPFFPGGSVRLF